MPKQAPTPTAKPAAAAMEGGGFYNRHSSMQAGGIVGLLPMLEKAARSIAIGEEPVVIADYGASQGRNSMGPMRIAIEEIRARTGAARVVQVIHTDLPSNDFAALFGALETDPASYLSGQGNVFPAAIGRSYFQPIIAPKSVHLGWNTWTMHWLDGAPIEAREHILPELSQDPNVVATLRQRLASDWERFLIARATELRPGGKMLTAFVGRTKDGHGWEWLIGEFWGAIVDLGKQGVLSDAEQVRLTLPVGPRSVEDVRKPFDATGSFAGLTLEQASLVDVPDPFWKAYEDSGDAATLGRSHADTTHAWSGPTLARCLGDRPDKAAVLDMIYDRLAERLAAAPRPHQTFLAVAVLAKA
jgi:SAM dependent carboxyl methyltransferase